MNYRRREPSVEQIWDAPELASLAILEMAADTAALALEAVHPEMQERDRDPNDESDALRAAITVTQLVQALGNALGRYRLALRRTHRQEDDIPW